jgi:Flp pilus assembly pilin Flp
MKKLLHKLLWSDDGPTAVEYAVMLALLMGVFFGSVQLIGQETKKSVEHSSGTIHTAFTEAGVGNL